MNRALISNAIGNIREEHITAALCRVPVVAARRRGRPERFLPVKRLAIVALAAALLLTLAVTATATGWFSSFFAKIGELYGVSNPERYERAGELSEKEPVHVDLAALPGHTFTLSESYYDGDELMLAYSLESMRYPVDFDFGPGDEGFEDLQPTGPWYISSQWQQEVSAEEYERICQELRGEKNTGFVIRTAYPGDHIRLVDGTDLGPILCNYTVDGQVILEPQEGLPESARSRDKLELVFTVREALDFYYKEGGTMYRYHASLREETVTITVPNIG